jgi:hypothetical protein
MTAAQQQDKRGDKLVLGEAVGLLFDRDELADKVIAGLSRALFAVSTILTL